MILAIVIGIYVVVGVACSRYAMREQVYNFNLYEEEVFKEIDDDIWEDVKDMYPIYKSMGDKWFKLVFYPLFTLLVPAFVLVASIKDLIKYIVKKFNKEGL